MTVVVRVWDLPTRLFHWSLAFCVLGLIVSGNFGGNAMQWHFRFGYCTGSLLLFRLIWGLIGGHWSRFSSFIYSPRHLLRFVSGHGVADDHIGHNPLGSLSVFAMLFFLILQVSSGFMSDDQIAAVGPFASHVSGFVVEYSTYYHKHVGKPLLLALIALHLLAIAFHYFVNHDNLVKPMLSGNKLLAIQATSSIDTARQRWTALIIYCLCVGLLACLVNWLDA